MVSNPFMANGDIFNPGTEFTNDTSYSLGLDSKNVYLFTTNYQDNDTILIQFDGNLLPENDDSNWIVSAWLSL